MGFCLTYDGDLSREQLARTVAERLELAPRLRQRVIRAPLAVAQPLWEDDPGFDLDHHIEEVRLESTADERELSRIGGALFAPALDLERPLWKMIVLRGAGVATTVIWKLHHALADLPAAFELAKTLHGRNDSAAASPGRTPSARREPPSSWGRLTDALVDQAATAALWSLEEASRLLDPTALSRRLARMAKAAFRTTEVFARTAPASPFNGHVSEDRCFAWTEYDLDDFFEVRAALGGTVNDVVLAVTGGALGSYMSALGYDTAGLELRVLCSVDVRQGDHQEMLGNHASWFVVPVPVSKSPVARLEAIRARTERIKREQEPQGRYELIDILRWAPPGWQTMATGLTDPAPLLNTVCGNGPGPTEPLFLAGHRLRRILVLGPLVADMGLLNTVNSYAGRLVMCAIVDPNRIPDPWSYVECLRRSFAELRAAI